jgi:hypothetical protein
MAKKARKEDRENQLQLALNELRWINTPVNYTSYAKSYSLIQQDVMLLVSGRLQDHFAKFLNEHRYLSKERPNGGITKEDLLKMGSIRLRLADFGIDSSHYDESVKVINQMKKIEFHLPRFDPATGLRKGEDYMPIFSKIFIPKNFTSREGEDLNYSGDSGTKLDEDGQEVRKFRRDGYIEVTINIEVAKAVFDMTDGYFNHLERIAYFCNSAYTSRLYLLLMKYASKGQMHPVIDYHELKDALGMFKVDVEKSDDTQPAKVVTTEKYQKFSQFRKQVLDVARGDMERLCEENKIEIMLSCVDPDKKGYEPIYRGSTKRGNPEKIKFHIKRTPLGVARDLELHRGSSEKRLCAKLMSLYPTLDEERLKTFVAGVPEDLWNDFKTYAYNGVQKAVEQPHRWSGTMEEFVFYIMEQWIKQHSAKPEPRQQTFNFAEVEEKPWEKEWQMFLNLIDKQLASDLRRVRYISLENGTVCLGATSKAQVEMIEAHFSDVAVLNHTKKCFAKVFGKTITLKYKIVKQ